MSVVIKEVEKNMTYTVNGKAVYRNMENAWIAPDELTPAEKKAFTEHLHGAHISNEKPKHMFYVLEEVAGERARQDAKWGQQNHNPIEWLAILGEEVGEANKEALETYFKYKGSDLDYSNYRKELIQIAAVAVAMVESLDRNNK